MSDVTAKGKSKYRKIISSDFLCGLGFRVLAILWCDDGSLFSSNRFTKHKFKDGGLKIYPYVEGKGTINLCESTYDELVLVADWVYSLTGVRFKIARSKGYPKLTANKKAMRIFLPQIAPYVPECMKYKVDMWHCRVNQDGSDLQQSSY